MTEYKFKGYDWTELAECWGITVMDQMMNVIGLEDEDDEEIRDLFMTPESIDIRYHINGTPMIFTTEDEEEVLAEKVKMHIKEELFHKENQSVRDDVNSFLEALIQESEDGAGADYNYPVYKGMLEVENNHTFGKWIIHNLELLWA